MLDAIGLARCDPLAVPVGAETMVDPAAPRPQCQSNPCHDHTKHKNDPDRPAHGAYLLFFTDLAGGFATAFRRASQRDSSVSASAALAAAMKALEFAVGEVCFFDILLPEGV